jgi:hypothetical protein
MRVREILSDRLNVLLWVTGGILVILLLGGFLVGVSSGMQMVETDSMMSYSPVLGIVVLLGSFLFHVLYPALIAGLVVLIISRARG